MAQPGQTCSGQANPQIQQQGPRALTSHRRNVAARIQSANQPINPITKTKKQLYQRRTGAGRSVAARLQSTNQPTHARTKIKTRPSQRRNSAARLQSANQPVNLISKIEQMAVVTSERHSGAASQRRNLIQSVSQLINSRTRIKNTTVAATRRSVATSQRANRREAREPDAPALPPATLQPANVAERSPKPAGAAGT